MTSQDNAKIENNFVSFYDYLLSKNYYFNKETIENYLLSLKVKPFVILTGNSGTGKTRLSQLFAKYLSNNYNLNEKFVNFNLNLIKIYYSKGTLNLPKNYLKDLIPVNRFEGYCDGLVDGLEGKVKIELIPRLYFKEDYVNRLDNISDKSNVNFKIKKSDITNYFNNDYYPKGNFDFSVKIGSSQSESRTWYLFKKDRNEFLKLKDNNNEIDIEINNELFKATFYTAVSITVLSNETLSPHLKELSRDNPDKKININLDLDSLKTINNSINTKVKVGKSGNSKGWTLNKSISEKLYPGNFKKDFQIFVNGISTKGNIQLLTRLFYKNNDLKEHLENLAKENSKQTIPLDIILNDNSNNNLSNNIKNSKNLSDNYKIIPVGANWTENRNIVGYYNLITNKYQSTPAFELINRSIEDKFNPYFLILDEMNLSHVERYFSDFLSAIESGEKIPLYGTKEELEIPKNLFVVGTVNIDETTYMFSPKVLDRANTIEFETISSNDYMNDNLDFEGFRGDVDFLENPLNNIHVSDLGIDELHNIFTDVKVNGDDFWSILSDEIFKFQSILKGSGFDFGFRVINEIVRFMVVAWVYEGKPVDWVNWERYFDAQIKQKMLPKLHGSKRIIGTTLDDLLLACLNDEEYIPQELNRNNVKYYNSALKIREMIGILDKQKYVSFIN